jgi:hypothetical protein
LKGHREELASQRGVPLSQMVAEACAVGPATVIRIFAEVREHGVQGIEVPIGPPGRPGKGWGIGACVRRLVRAKLNAPLTAVVSSSWMGQHTIGALTSIPSRSPPFRMSCSLGSVHVGVPCEEA